MDFLPIERLDPIEKDLGEPAILDRKLDRVMLRDEPGIAAEGFLEPAQAAHLMAQIRFSREFLPKLELHQGDPRDSFQLSARVGVTAGTAEPR
jgi:hypothetical protein